jgi:diguanylate cyclase (GGDEF)-like protein/PAS domain S-box-containing protein
LGFKGDSLDFQVFEHIYDGIVIYDEEGLIQYCNHAFSEVAGVSPTRMIGKTNLTKVFYEIEGEALHLQDFVEHKEATNTKMIRFKTKAIEEGTGQFSISPISSEGKKYFIFVLRDLSVEKELQRKYRREMGLKDKKIEEMNSLILLLQKTRLVKEPRKILEEFLKHFMTQFSLGIGFIREGATQVFKVQSQNQIGHGASYDVLAKKIQELPPLKDYLRFQKSALDGLGLSNVPNLNELVGIKFKSNQKDQFEIYIPLPNPERAALFDHQRVLTLAEQMAVVIDNMALEKLSIFDDLTKLYNARYFREKMDELTANQPQLTLILMDIDFFKKVNDTYGHAGGDAVLSVVGRILKEAGEKENKDNVVARVGGEEFAILMPGKTVEQAEKLATYIGNVARGEVVPFDDKQIKVTMSFGVSDWNPAKYNVREFYKRADAALYDSKRNGRDRVTVLKSA